MIESEVTPELAYEHGLTPDEYERIINILGRTPSYRTRNFLCNVE
jgi:phosphoribosylformylglycinamidine synthase subunit PurL